MGLGLSLRGLHAGEETCSRLLRDADALGNLRIGWANATIVAGKLDVEVGYVKAAAGAEFRRELDAEIARLAEFLRPAGA